jgi:hypothetical protein
MLVCRHCLIAIESHEGQQVYKNLEWTDERIDENDECFCEWCEEYYDKDEIVELL